MFLSLRSCHPREGVRNSPTLSGQAGGIDRILSHLSLQRPRNGVNCCGTQGEIAGNLNTSPNENLNPGLLMISTAENLGASWSEQRVQDT